MKATELLQRQHRDLEALLDRLRSEGQHEDSRLRQDLAANLVAHTAIEEEIFYPAAREIVPEETLEAYEEHGLADVELARLLAGKPGEETLDAKISVLTEVVSRHIRREESDILRMADRELGDEQLDSLGEQMEARFRQVLATGYGKQLRKALDAVVPRSTSPAAPSKRRAPKKATKRPRNKATTTRRSSPAAGAKLGTRAGARKGAKPSTSKRRARARA